MIISLKLKNFFSLRDEAVIDFTAENFSHRTGQRLAENLITFKGDDFVNIIGLFGSNASGKSNIIKAINFCRNLVLNSHLSNEGDKFDFEPFKFDINKPSEFEIKFVTSGTEYEYSFKIFNGKIISENLYHYPKNRKSKIFSRDNTNLYSHRKGVLARPTEVEANTGPRTLFLSRASSMNRPVAQQVYRFFLNEMSIDSGTFNLSEFTQAEFDQYKDILLKAFEISDSDIIDLHFIEAPNGQSRLLSFHQENSDIPFDFEKEESEGTKRLLILLMLLIRKASTGATIFLDEFDLKLHLRLSELILEVIRASKGAQLLFTSHNPTLINTNKLRRDQIVFVSKQSNGNSEFVPLSDFEGINKNLDIQKAYIQGRFDAVPYVGDIYPIFAKLISKK